MEHIKFTKKYGVSNESLQSSGAARGGVESNKMYFEFDISNKITNEQLKAIERIYKDNSRKCELLVDFSTAFKKERDKDLISYEGRTYLKAFAFPRSTNWEEVKDVIVSKGLSPSKYEINIFLLGFNESINNILKEETSMSAIAFLPSQLGVVKAVVGNLAQEADDWDIEILDKGKDYKSVNFGKKVTFNVPHKHWDSFNKLFGGHLEHGKSLKVKGLFESSEMLPEPQQILVDEYGFKDSNSRFKFFILSNGKVVDVPRGYGHHKEMLDGIKVNMQDLWKSGCIRAMNSSYTTPGGSIKQELNLEINAASGITESQIYCIERLIYGEIGSMFIDFYKQENELICAFQIPIEYRNEDMLRSHVRDIFFSHGEIKSKYKLTEAKYKNLNYDVLFEANTDELKAIRSELMRAIQNFFNLRKFKVLRLIYLNFRKNFKIKNATSPNCVVALNDIDKGILNLYGKILKEYGEDRGTLEMIVEAFKEQKSLGKFSIFGKNDFICGLVVESNFEGVALVLSLGIGINDVSGEIQQSLYVGSLDVIDEIKDRKDVKTVGSKVYPTGDMFTDSFFSDLNDLIVGK
jgi:hypothetical protein